MLRVLIILFLLPGYSFCQEFYSSIELKALFNDEDTSPEIVFLQGNFEDGFPVKFSISRYQNQLKGFISYANHEKPYQLEGYILEDGNYVFRESYQGIQCGNYKVLWQENNDYFEATWTSMNKEIVYSLTGSKSVEKGSESRRHLEHKLFSWKTSNFHIQQFQDSSLRFPTNMFTENDAYSLNKLNQLYIGKNLANNGFERKDIQFLNKQIVIDSNREGIDEVDSILVDFIFHLDYFQRIKVAIPQLRHSAVFNQYINQNVDEWVNQILQYSQINIEEAPGTRWIHDHLIWFDPYYMDENLISGALFLKSSIHSLNKVQMINFNFTKERTIEVGSIFRNFGRLQDFLEVSHQTTLDSDMALGFCKTGLIICSPFDMVHGYGKKVVSHDLVEHELRFFGEVRNIKKLWK